MSAVLEYPQRHAIRAEEYLRMGEAKLSAAALLEVTIAVAALFPE